MKNKENERLSFFNWFDRIGEAADFVNTDHLNLIDLSKPPLSEPGTGRRKEKNE